jgi:acetyl esterase
MHGGGWQHGSIDELVVDAACRERAVGAGCVVGSVDYRLAPEHPFPTALHDCYAALTWLVQRSARLGLRPELVSVGGASAGGNLAAALALLCRDRGGPPLAFQLLEVPALDLDLASLSPAAFEVAVDLSEPALSEAASVYAAGTPRDDPLLSPLRATSLADLPPAHVMTAELDPLREQGEAYAARLCAAGVAATCTRHPGALHGSGFLTRDWSVARSWRDEVLAVLRDVHGLPTSSR